MSELLLASRNKTEKLYVDSVFSTFLYQGNGATQTINNGIDLAGEGGMVWIKGRDFASNHVLVDSARGRGSVLRPDMTNPQAASGAGQDVTSLNSNGFSLGTIWQANANDAGRSFASWTFRKAPKFFDIVTYTGNGVAGRLIPHELGIAPGMVIIKRIDSTSNWVVGHRSDNQANTRLNATSAGGGGYIGTNAMTSELISVWADGTVSSCNTSGAQYVAYLFAHDESEDGIIQCGSYVGNGSANGPIVTLGYEPQMLFIKRVTGGDGNWIMLDSLRGMPVGSTDQALYANSSMSEFSSQDFASTVATGFQLTNTNSDTNASGSSYIYLAIRRPNKPPTSGTEVYNAIARTGTGVATKIAGIGFPPDSVLTGNRDTASGAVLYDRMRGANSLLRALTTNSEVTSSNSITSFDGDGYSVGVDINYGYVNTSGYSTVGWIFRRAPGVYDQICYNGSGANKTEAHTLLGVPPELWRARRRNGTGSWVYGSTHLAATEKIIMPAPNGRVTDATVWNGAYPTKSAISLGTHADVNAAGGTYMLEMWATLRGVSKVGKYTGNGATQNVECGFTTGARFIKIIRMTAGVAQDIFIWDTARGIVAANDPHLSLNSTAAEVTTDDSVDPYVGGFAVNQNAATNINVNGAEYLFLAYS